MPRDFTIKTRRRSRSSAEHKTGEIDTKTKNFSRFLLILCVFTLVKRRSDWRCAYSRFANISAAHNFFTLIRQVDAMINNLLCSKVRFGFFFIIFILVDCWCRQYRWRKSGVKCITYNRCCGSEVLTRGRNKTVHFLLCLIRIFSGFLDTPQSTRFSPINRLLLSNTYK